MKAVRKAVGEKFIIIFRLSMLDLVEQGSTFEDVIELAKGLEDAGVTIINTGIGWHEARIPTIATQVPRGAFTWVTEKVKPHVSVPIVTCNRINSPDEAERILASGQADMVSMARPFLADPYFVAKAEQEKAQLLIRVSAATKRVWTTYLKVSALVVSSIHLPVTKQKLWLNQRSRRKILPL